MLASILSALDVEQLYNATKMPKVKHGGDDMRTMLILLCLSGCNWNYQPLCQTACHAGGEIPYDLTNNPGDEITINEGF